jgi:hypothetical protein
MAAPAQCSFRRANKADGPPAAIAARSLQNPLDAIGCYRPTIKDGNLSIIGHVGW